MPNFLLSISSFFIFLLHPFYMSVTEVNHNAKTKTLEISCHIFTDDFEKDYKVRFNKAIDLSHPIDKAVADKYVENYLKEKLKITVDGKNLSFNYIGYEINEDAVWSYLEIANVPTVKQIKIYDAILIDRIPEQTNLIHFTFNGKRQSTKLENQKTEALFSY